MPGAGADPIWSEPEPPKKVAAPQHCLVQPNLQFASKEQFYEKSTYGLLSHIFALGINYGLQSWL